MKWKLYSAYSLFAIISLIQAFLTSWENPIPLYACYASLFVIYFYLLQELKKETDLKPAILLSVGIRLVLILAVPNLSADFWRSIWDGKFQAIGFSPYSLTPKELMNRNLNTFLNAGNVYHHLIDPKTYSSAAPIIEFINYLIIKLSMNHDRAVPVLMKFVIWSAEIVSISQLIALFKRFEKPNHFILFYALNPFIIFEFAGNANYLAIPICFLLVSIHYWFESKKFFSLVFYSVAVGANPAALVLLPLILMRQTLKANIKTILFLTIFVLAIYYPYFRTTDLRINYWNGILANLQNLQFSGSFQFLNWFSLKFNWIALSYYAYMAFLAIPVVGIYWVAIKNSKADAKNFFSNINSFLHQWLLVLSCTLVTAILVRFIAYLV